MMTRKEIFEKVKNHLLTQKVRSEGWAPLGMPVSTAICRYRGDNGTKCAIGCLIADEFYSESLEGKTYRACEVESALIRSGIAVDQDLGIFRLLDKLQLLHDRVEPADWELMLDRIESKDE